MTYILKLLRLFRPYSMWMMAGIALSFVSLLASVILMGTSGWFLASMGVAGVAGVTMNYFSPAAIIRACAIVRTGGRYAERLVTHEATFRLIAQLRSWFYDRLIPLAPAVFNQSQTGDILSRIKGDIDVLDRFYIGFLIPLSVAVLGIVAMGMIYGFYNPTVAITMVGLLVVTGLIIPLILFLMTKSQEDDLIAQNATIKTHCYEMFQGADELLVYDQQGHYHTQFETMCVDRVTTQTRRNQWKNAIQNMVVLTMAVALYCVFIFYVPTIGQANQNGVLVAMMVVLTMAAFDFVTPMMAAFQGVGGVMRATRRIFDLVEETSSKDDDGQTSVTPTKIISNQNPITVAFDAVKFAYDSDHPAILDDVSFTLNPGETMAVIGPTGCGKSSLINLLMRFYNPQGGVITVNGHDINDYVPDDIRALFSVLPQTPYIFAGTIRDNLAIANPNATDAMMDTAMQQAGLYDFVHDLPKGYDTMVGEHGQSLSGGQMKRLALARALVKDAPCLVLDEMGEGLDYQMEDDILRRLIDGLGDKSLIVITHRASVLPNPDHVLHL